MANTFKRRANKSKRGGSRPWIDVSPQTWDAMQKMQRDWAQSSIPDERGHPVFIGYGGDLKPVWIQPPAGSAMTSQLRLALLADIQADRDWHEELRTSAVARASYLAQIKRDH